VVFKMCGDMAGIRSKCFSLLDLILTI
jgi:hypothetical protein